MMSPGQKGLYWKLWAAACKAQGWNPKDDEQRHAMHAEALRKYKSSNLFNNKDFDRVKARLIALAKPNSVAAAMEVVEFEESDRAAGSGTPSLDGTKYGDIQEADDPGERKRLLWRCRKLFIDDIIIDVCANGFATKRWTELPISKLTLLRDILVKRARTLKRQQKIDAQIAAVVVDEAEAWHSDDAPVPADDPQHATALDDNCPY